MPVNDFNREFLRGGPIKFVTPDWVKNYDNEFRKHYYVKNTMMFGN